MYFFFRSAKYLDGIWRPSWKQCGQSLHPTKQQKRSAVYYSMPFLENGDPSAVKVDKDKSFKNSWRWEWLEERTDVEVDGKVHPVRISDWCRKVPEAGHCFCILCTKKINYGSNGKKALRGHAEHPKHKDAYKVRCSVNFVYSKLEDL